MNSAQDGLVTGSDIAVNQRNVFLVFAGVFKGVNLEFAKFRRQF